MTSPLGRRGIEWTVADQGDHLIGLASRVVGSPVALTAVIFDGAEVQDHWRRGARDIALSRRLSLLLNDLGTHVQTAFDPDYRLAGALIRSVRVAGRIAVIDVQAEVVLRTLVDLTEPEEPVAVAYSIADWAADGRGTLGANGGRTFALSPHLDQDAAGKYRL